MKFSYIIVPLYVDDFNIVYKIYEVSNSIHFSQLTYETMMVQYSGVKIIDVTCTYITDLH